MLNEMVVGIIAKLNSYSCPCWYAGCNPGWCLHQPECFHHKEYHTYVSSGW